VRTKERSKEVKKEAHLINRVQIHVLIRKVDYIILYLKKYNTNI